MSNITKSDDWIQWKQTCAYKRCSEEARDRLGKFGWKRMSKRLLALGLQEQFKRDHDTDPASASWHWVDSHVIFKGTLHQRPYKDALFEMCPTVSEIEKYTSKATFRAAAKEFGRYYAKGAAAVSLDRPTENDDGNDLYNSFSAPDALPPEDQLEFREFAEFFEQEASTVFNELEEVTKIAILASSLGLSLDNTIVNELAGLQHTTLYDRVRNALNSVISRLSQIRASKGTLNIFEEVGDVGSAKELARCVARNVFTKLATDWGRNFPENKYRDLFRLSENTNET